MPAPVPSTKKPTRRPRVPRWVVFVVACVFLGVVTSVGVAWGVSHTIVPGPTVWPQTAQALVEFGHREPNSVYFIRVCTYELEFKKLWNFYSMEYPVMTEPQGPPVRVFGDFAAQSSRPACQAALRHHLPLFRTPDARYVKFSVSNAGWPLPCLDIEDACTASDVKQQKQSTLTYDYERQKYRDLEEVPTADPAFDLWPWYFTPLWPGLLADTAFYGGAWAVLLGTPILIRRWIGSRRGGCPGCGYSLEGLKEGAPCPECGRAPTTRPGATASEASPLASGS